MRKFEYDKAKSLRNKLKHGIDFEQAKKLWSSSFTETQAYSEIEVRTMIIGSINNVFWTAIVTMRLETVRIISVRRSREEEKQVYKERAKKDHD